MRAPQPLDEAPPKRFTLDDGQGLRLQVMDIGATWLSCTLALGAGVERELLLGHAGPADHLNEPGYLGSVVGRYANRIAGARFALEGRVHQLTANEGPNQLHGGPRGFDHRRWAVLSAGPRHLSMALDSADGDQGFPGNLRAVVSYSLPQPGCLRLSFETRADQRCPVSLTSHAYFNLDGDARNVLGHSLSVLAEHYLPVDDASIPSGEFAPVAGTRFDLRSPRPLRQALGAQGVQTVGAIPSGYDHCLVLDARRDIETVPVAELVSSDGRVAMQIFTNYPGLQVYSGQYLAQSKGRDGKPLAAQAGIALEAQHFPDAPNRPEWPEHGVVLQPGRVRKNFIAYRFASTR